MALTIGRTRTPGLWILGNPYILGAQLEKSPARLDEFLFLIMNSMGNFIGNYIEVADIVQFFSSNTDVMRRCESSLERHISARKRAFRPELHKYQENSKNCQCHVCTARAMCNIDEMHEYWCCLEELLLKLCADETMEEEAANVLETLREFYFTLQFDLPVCCRRKDKKSVIRKCIEEELLRPLKKLVLASKYDKKKTEPAKSIEHPESSKPKSPTKDDKRKKQRSKISLSPTSEGLPKAPQSTSPRKKVQTSGGDAKPSTSKMLMQEEEDVTVYELALDHESEGDEEGATAQEEPSEFILKMVKKGGIYMPSNLEELPEELKNVFKRIADAAKMIVDAPPSTSAAASPAKSRKHKPKKTTEVLTKPVLVVSPPVEKKIQIIPHEVQEAMDVFPQLQRYGLSAKPSSVKLTEPDPERIKLEDLMASGSFKKHKQPENPFKLTQKRQAERVKLSHALHRSSSIEKLPSEFPDDEPIMPFKLQPPQPKSPPGAKQPDTTKLLKDELDKTTIGKKLFETVFGVQDDDKIFQLEELMKIEQPAIEMQRPVPVPKEPRAEEKKVSKQSRLDPNLASSSKQTTQAQYYPQDVKPQITYDEKDLEVVDLSEASYEYGFEYSDDDEEEELTYDEASGSK
nr:titin-like isoform X2 [Onthophagus taurus]